jgi:uncharacterized protein
VKTWPRHTDSGLGPSGSIAESRGGSERVRERAHTPGQHASTSSAPAGRLQHPRSPLLPFGLEPLPAFPLFRDPIAEQSLEQSHAVCASCELARGWIYTQGTYGPGDNERTLCPWCIADGSAAAKFDCFFNDATIYPYRDDVPQLPPEDRELVERRTPGFVTWQGNHWLMCCGRACIYIGEAGKGDLTPCGRWAAAAPSILQEVQDWTEEQRSGFISSIGQGSPCAYIFECQVCKSLKAYGDMD